MKAEELYTQLFEQLEAVFVENPNVTQKAQKACLAVLEENKESFLELENGVSNQSTEYVEHESEVNFENALSVFKHLSKVMKDEQVDTLAITFEEHRYNVQRDYLPKGNL